MRRYVIWSILVISICAVVLVGLLTNHKASEKEANWSFLDYEKLEQEYLAHLPHMQIEEMQYECSESPEVFSPRLSLSFKDGLSYFSYTMLSSTIEPGCHFEVESDSLILKTAATAGMETYPQKTYTFKIDGSNLVFDAKRSTKMPNYAYSAGAKPQAPVEDGAVFKPVVIHLTPMESEDGIYYEPMLIDSMLADIDKDGEIEYCALRYGRTSGIFSFEFEIRELGAEEPEYLTGFAPVAHCDLSFMRDGTGHFYLRAEGRDYKTPTLLKIELKKGKIFLNEDGKEIDEEFWGAKGAEMEASYWNG